jgi:hypothetical protein
MTRVKKLYTEYKSRADDLARRESNVGVREGEMQTREDLVSRRDATVRGG